MSKVEFGWPLPKRQLHFIELEKTPEAKKYETSINFMDQDIVISVYRIPIGLPKYRLLNGRTSSLQQQWLATHQDKPRTYFAVDPEREEVQKVQHELLKELANGKDLLPYFTNPSNKQKDFLILDNLGYVINGNRRLCAWRELLLLDEKKYSHFEYIDIIILPPSDQKAIDKLEGTLQIEKDIRDDYSWHALANMMIDRMKIHGLDEKMLSEFYGLSESEVKNYIEMRNYADEYLKDRDKEGQWTIVSGKKYAFEQMVNKRKQLVSSGEKRLFETEAYVLIDDPTGGRLYESIPDLFKYRDVVQEKLLIDFPINIEPTIGDDLLGSNIKEEIDHALAQKINDMKNRHKALEIIKDTIETQRSLEKERDTAKYVLKQLQRANASVQSALAATKNSDTLKDGVEETIKSIDVGLTLIRKWLFNE
jgi:hypothetical protein